MITPLLGFLWPQLVAKTRPPRYYTQRRKQSVAHKSGTQLYGMDVRGIRTSSQDDAEDGYSLDERVNLKFGKEFHELSFVCAKTLLEGVQLAL